MGFNSGFKGLNLVAVSKWSLTEELRAINNSGITAANHWPGHILNLYKSHRYEDHYNHGRFIRTISSCIRNCLKNKFRPDGPSSI